MKLSYKFVGVAMLAALLPLAGAGVKVIKETEASLRETAVRLQQGLSERVAESVRSELDGAIDQMTVITRILGTGTPSSPLNALLNSHPIFVDLWALDGKGKVQAAVHRLRPAQGLEAVSWNQVRQQIDERGYYSSGWETPSGVAPRLLMAVPRWNSNGGFAGVVAARLNMFVLSEALRGLRLGGESYFFSKSGHLLAHSSEANLFKSGFPVSKGWTAADWADGEHLDPRGKKILAARVEIPRLDAWALSLQSLPTALAPASALRKRIATSLVIAALFAVGLALALGGFVTRPLRNFHRVVRGMQEGQFDEMVEVNSSDELGDMARALKEAQPILEKKVRDSVLGKMSRLLGHDLRQPVQALRSSLEAIFGHVSGADATALKHRSLCLDALDWMEDFIEDILTVGRERPLAPRLLSISDLAKNVIDKMNRSKNISVVLDLASDTPLCSLDEKEVRKAFTNVVKNAMEALGTSGHIHITSARTEREIALIVQDNGPGISDDKKARLFDEFTTKSSGTGLGLLVVKRVMDRHRGRVDIDSGPGGTTVSLWFPL